MEIDALRTFRRNDAQRYFVPAFAVDLDGAPARRLFRNREGSLPARCSRAIGGRADVPPVGATREKFPEFFVGRKDLLRNCFGSKLLWIQRIAFCHCCFAHGLRPPIWSRPREYIPSPGAIPSPATSPLRSGGL